MTKTSIPKSGFPIRDLKLEALARFALEDWSLPTATNPNLEPVLRTFRSNIAQSRFLILLPTHIAGATALTQRVHDLAEYAVTGTLCETGKLSSVVESSVDERRVLMLRDVEREWSNKSDREALDFHLGAARSLLGLAETPHGAMMLLSAFPAHIVGAWTNIETMLSDLWEAALNCHPATLAALKGKAKRIRGDPNRVPAEIKASTDNEQKVVPLYLIEMESFDLRSSMGTVFRRQRRFEFARLSGVRAAYSCAFSVKSSRIDGALESTSFDELNAVRNAIVHKAGLADAEYVKRAAYLKIPKTEVGEPIHLDGEVVSTLIGSAIASSKSLIIAVDDWLQNN